MYTLIICSEDVIKNCTETYKAFIRPLEDTQCWDFCRWDNNGENLAQACPELEHLISRHREWRAVIINDLSVSSFDNISKINPFDIAGSVKDPEYFQSIEEISEYRNAKEIAFKTAIENPLMKLTSWLLGSSVANKPIPLDIADLSPDNPDEKYIENARDRRIDLIEVEIDKAICRKYDIYHSRFEDQPQIFNRPKHVVVIGERRMEDNEPFSSTFNFANEFEYSRFYEDNMYHKALRYILYDINYVNHNRDKDMYFGMLVFAAVMAKSHWPYEALRPERVYKAEAIISENKMTELCGKYISKLKKTEKEIGRRIDLIKNERIGSISNIMAQELFESDEKVNVKIDSVYDKSKLMADSKGIGLFSDYPEDENSNWNDQFKGIKKLFTRFIREPQRAVKVAAHKELREKNTIDDERVLRLDEFQLENIEYRLLEEEQNMIEVEGMHIFDAERYQNKMNKASTNINEAIKRRITRSHALKLSLISFCLLFIGFVPFITGGIKEGKVIIPFALAVVSLLVLAASILMILIIQWIKMKRVYESFNDEMDDIYYEISNGIGRFSDYLSHVCNVMREFSVLNMADDAAIIKCETMAQHARDIEERIDEIYRLFFNHINENIDFSDETVPYDYNFTALKHYNYEMPYSGELRKIEFLQQGFEIEIPVDYLDRITMRREEFYD